jgi:hypothetical protein
MEKKDGFTKGLAITGTALVWFPILAPIVLAFVALATMGQFLFDYLMPAELFPSALLGGTLLVWAAIRERSRLGLVAWGLGGAAGLLVGTQALAVVTGLASGASEPSGWRWALVTGGLVAFVAALIVLGIGGILLLRDLFRPANR